MGRGVGRGWSGFVMRSLGGVRVLVGGRVCCRFLRCYYMVHTRCIYSGSA
jgi:hypothetical protein